MFREQMITLAELNRAEQLMYQGKMAEAHSVIEGFLSKKISDPKVPLIGKLLKIRLLLQMGAYHKALRLTEEVLKACQEQEFPLLAVDAHIAKAKALDSLGQYDEVCHEIDHAEERLLILSDESSEALVVRKAVFASLRGSAYSEMGRMNEALESLSQSIAFCEQVGEKRELMVSLNIIGNIYGEQGDLNQAMANYQRALEIAEEIGSKWYMLRFFHNIGLSYYMKGDLDLALGRVQQNLALAEETNRIDMTIMSLSGLVLIAVEMGLRDQAQRYTQQLQQINVQMENKLVSQAARLATAIFLKTSSRMRDKVQAQEMLQQLVEEEVIQYAVTAYAILTLCALLLEELQAYGDVRVLQQALTLLNRLYSEAQDRHSYFFIVETLILKAKLALVEGDLAAAFKFLDQASLISEEKDLGLLAARVQSQKRQLQDHYDQWQTLIQSNVSIQTRLEHTQVADYLKEVQKQIALMK